MKLIATAVVVLATVFSGFIDGYDCEIVQFIFGDSLSDNGNNNRLSKSFAQASLPWYGIDFGNGMPNGRFTNGRTVADIIGKVISHCNLSLNVILTVAKGDKMGLPRPPPFLDPSLSEDIILAKGVNFASGGGGILNETGGLFVQRFSLYKQIELFNGVQTLIRGQIGDEAATKFFQGAKYVVALGSNDFINNYLMPIYSDSWTYNDDTFIDYLMETLDAQLTVLHGMGARELMVFGLGPMGCIPLQRVLSSSGECQEKTNTLALNFNKAATKLMDDLSAKLPNASYKFGDAYDVVNNVITNPSKYGFDNADAPCCSFGRIRPALTCIPASRLCKDRSKYLFWDEYHPSDRANELIAEELIRKLGFKTINQTDGGSPSPTSAPAPSDG